MSLSHFRALLVLTALSFWIPNASAEVPQGKSIQVGTVKITLTPTQFQMQEQSFERSDSSLDYIYILSTPYVSLHGADGVVELDKSSGILPLPTDLTEASFPKFPFFSNQPTTIGFLKGYAGASGGGAQELFFFDTTSQAFAKVSLAEMNTEWLGDRKRPQGFIERNLYCYYGGHASMIGYRPRITGYYIITPNGAERNIELERAECQKEYDAASFSPKEIEEIKRTKPSGLNNDLAIKVLDKLYYGLRLDKKKEMEDFLSLIGQEYYSEVEETLKEAMDDSDIMITIDPAHLSADQFYYYEFRIIALNSGSGGSFLEERHIEWLKKAVAILEAKGIKLKDEYQRGNVYGSSYFHLGEYQKAVEEYRKVGDVGSVENAEWFLNNGEIKNGTVKIVEYPGEIPYGEDFLAAQAQDKQYLFASFFKGPIYRYDKANKKHAIIFAPAWNYDWVDSLKWDGKRLVMKCRDMGKSVGDSFEFDNSTSSLRKLS